MLVTGLKSQAAGHRSHKRQKDDRSAAAELGRGKDRGNLQPVTCHMQLVMNFLIFLFPDYVKMGPMKTPDYFSVWKKREKEEKRRRNLAIKTAKSVAKTLKEKYQAEEIILFGSLIWRPDFLWRGTDIDLIVKGL